MHEQLNQDFRNVLLFAIGAASCLAILSQPALAQENQPPQPSGSQPLRPLGQGLERRLLSHEQILIQVPPGTVYVKYPNAFMKEVSPNEPAAFTSLTLVVPTSTRKVTVNLSVIRKDSRLLGGKSIPAFTKYLWGEWLAGKKVVQRRDVTLTERKLKGTEVVHVLNRERDSHRILAYDDQYLLDVFWSRPKGAPMDEKEIRTLIQTLRFNKNAKRLLQQERGRVE